MASLLVGGLILALGRLDIVAVAPGVLTPDANVKVVQSAMTGVVRAILVKNGERVNAGQLLLELDSTQSAADSGRAHANRTDAQLAIARAHALLDAQDKHAEPKVAMIAGATPERQTDTQTLAESVYGEYRHKLLSLSSQIQKQQADLQTAREEIEKLSQTAPIAQQQAEDYKALAQDHYVASHEYLEKEKTAIEQKQEWAAQESRVVSLQAGIAAQRLDMETTEATFRREQLETLNKSEQEAAQGVTEQIKADARQGLTQLRSPVAGIVQQLSVHTVGGVVTSAQTLMEIVPDDQLEVEARISNRDIGFVNPGQNVVVKISTFPYTRYGYLDGRVISVSNDATSDKKLGLTFLARIAIPDNHFRVGDKRLNLSPGMEVTAEIKTGKQRVWQYFLSPLIQASRESLRER